MPQMGVSVAEGTIVAWRVEVGDRIEADETICEISTDKIDTEVPAPTSGVVAEILVPVDTTVAVGTVLARIGGAAGTSATDDASATAGPATDAPATDAPATARPAASPGPPDDLPETSGSNGAAGENGGRVSEPQRQPGRYSPV